MKRILQSISLMAFCTTGLLQAQSIKNIYQSNGAILRLPTSMIDKVQTVNEGGEQVLKITQESGSTIQIPISKIDSITHHAGNTLNPEILGELILVSVMGVVRGVNGLPIKNVKVSAGYSHHETYTDLNGVFFLNNILAFENLGFIQLEKTGFFKGFRSFQPVSQGRNMLYVNLLTLSISGTVNGTSGGNVNANNGLNISFPANAFSLNGQAYSGNVQIYAHALDPSSDNMFDRMPGDLIGALDNDLQILRSFGMAAIEITDNNNNPLQLLDGKMANLRFQIPETMLAEAPEQIEFWSFDEQAGYWQFESMAQKQGNEYLAEAAHFSWWNVDLPFNFYELKGVIRDLSGTPINGARIKVVSENSGSGIRYSNEYGSFSGAAPRSQTLTANVQLFCETTSSWVTEYSQEISPLNNNSFIEINSDLSGNYSISGTLLNCQNQAVQNGYVLFNGSSIHLVNEGYFSFNACTSGFYNIKGYDVGTESIKVSDLIDVEVGVSGVAVGQIIVCTALFDEVTDFRDGISYQTIPIGDQVWMAENLKYLPSVAGSGEGSFTTPLYYVYGYSGTVVDDAKATANYNTYGVLYNWAAAMSGEESSITNPSGVQGICPSGWHLPSAAEWTELTDFLGGLEAGDKLKEIGALHWENPLPGATNASGFTALPGGNRNAAGEFGGLRGFGFWWSSTESITDHSFIRSLNSYSHTIEDGSFFKTLGFSVRCLRD